VPGRVEVVGVLMGHQDRGQVTHLGEGRQRAGVDEQADVGVHEQAGVPEVSELHGRHRTLAVRMRLPQNEH
jgi:hypothetical protein